MATDNTEPFGDEEPQREQRDDERDLQADAKRVASTVRERDSNGTVSILAGVTLLAWTLRTASRSKARAALMGLAGAALLKRGVGKRGSSDDSSFDRMDSFETDDYGTAESDETNEDESDVSDEAHAHRQQSDVLNQSETNPRGTSGEPDVESETDSDEGSIQFTDDQNDGPRSEPHLDEEGPHDPRMEDDDDEVEVDLSEASMADEASEAVGPTPEQSQPSSTEGTEPEPTPAEDASHMEADVPDEEDSDADSGDDETEDDESDDDLTAGSS